MRPAEMAVTFDKFGIRVGTFVSKLLFKPNCP